MADEKKGQASYISRSWPSDAPDRFIAEPKPYQPGSRARDCDQEKTQGIARRPSMVRLAWHDAGRLPMLRSAIPLIGVASKK